MKKTILAVVVTGLFASTAHAANVYDNDGIKADVYGRMQFDLRNGAYDEDTNNDHLSARGSARMGFKVSSEINDDLKAVGRGEWQISAENTEEFFKPRHVYVGLASDSLGSVNFGQSDTAFYQAVAATDIFNTFGYEAFTLIETGRQTDQIMYAGQFGGFYVGASFQFETSQFEISIGNPDDPTVGLPERETGHLDKSYGLTLGYDFDFGLGMYAGVHQQDFQLFDKTNYALSAYYARDDLYLAAAYVYADIDGDELTGYDVVAAYTINAFWLYTGYAVQDAQDDLEELLGTDTPADALKFGVQYKLNSNAKVWIEYLIDNSDLVISSGTTGEDQVNLAMQYNF